MNRRTFNKIMNFAPMSLSMPDARSLARAEEDRLHGEGGMPIKSQPLRIWRTPDRQSLG